jgi:23S rRNA (cytosine1962-C5)-methyltransferase
MKPLAMTTLEHLVDRALAARAILLQELAAESTDCLRLFHGAAEGREGLAIDRYGPLVLVQTFRGPLASVERAAVASLLRERMPETEELAFVDRGNDAPPEEDSKEHVCREFGTAYFIRARHRGKDPWLFLDLRAGRRYLRSITSGSSVLNLFAYSCAAGVSAAAAGAKEVWNVDFARSALEVGRRNAARNGIAPETVRFVHEDCLPVLRQLAGLPVKGRGSHGAYARFEPRTFDIVFLDPPTWSTGAFGAVDVERDYPALFKPALLATAPGGYLIATNHSASVEKEAWVGILKRCAEKIGRPLAEIEILGPEVDFPSRDGRSPLKIAVCHTAP